MKRSDVALTPQIPYKNTKTAIEALDGLVEGMEAYATDTQEKGIYDGAAWVWGSTGGGESIPVVTSDPVSPTDGQMWKLRETSGSIPDGQPIGLLLALTYTGNSGATSRLKLSMWDDVAGEIIRYAGI